MGRKREPVSLLIAKGKSHFSKEEIEERKKSEVKVSNDLISAPRYLSAKHKREFEEIAQKLVKSNIMTNLDIDALACYIVAKEDYLKSNKLLKSIAYSAPNIDAIDKASKIQDRAYRQLNQAARELGLTISSRCKLVIPKSAEEPKVNKFSKFNKTGAG